MSLGWPELIVLLIVVVLIFGTTRLAGLGKASGRAIREFKEETQGLKGGKNQASLEQNNDAAQAGMNATQVPPATAFPAQPQPSEFVQPQTGAQPMPGMPIQPQGGQPLYDPNSTEQNRPGTN